MTSFVLSILMFAVLMALIALGGWLHARGDRAAEREMYERLHVELEREMEAKYGKIQPVQKMHGLTRAEMERKVSGVRPPGNARDNWR